MAKVDRENQSCGVATSGVLADGVGQFGQHRRLELGGGIGSRLGRLAARVWSVVTSIVHEASRAAPGLPARPSTCRPVRC